MHKRTLNHIANVAKVVFENVASPKMIIIQIQMQRPTRNDVKTPNAPSEETFNFLFVKFKSLSPAGANATARLNRASFVI